MSRVYKGILSVILVAVTGTPVLAQAVGERVPKKRVQLILVDKAEGNKHEAEKTGSGRQDKPRRKQSRRATGAEGE